METQQTTDDLEGRLLEAKTLGALLRLAREKKHTQIELANLVDTSPTTIANIEVDKLLPGAKTITTLVQALHLSEAVEKHMRDLKLEAEDKRDQARIVKKAETSGLRLTQSNPEFQDIYDQIDRLVAQEPTEAEEVLRQLKDYVGYLAHKYHPNPE